MKYLINLSENILIIRQLEKIFLNVRRNRMLKIQNHIEKNNREIIILAETKMNLINECLLLMNLLMNSIKVTN